MKCIIYNPQQSEARIFTSIVRIGVPSAKQTHMAKGLMLHSSPIGEVKGATRSYKATVLVCQHI